MQISPRKSFVDEQATELNSSHLQTITAHFYSVDMNFELCSQVVTVLQYKPRVLQNHVTTLAQSHKPITLLLSPHHVTCRSHELRMFLFSRTLDKKPKSTLVHEQLTETFLTTCKLQLVRSLEAGSGAANKNHDHFVSSP
ncbi:hypothetical protein BaRGS_00029388 [Batillaria attramentaria]|uniref:Uncharacterized protein n=1 Tax=Batillaria attramentaria TaxID=370345 RepID=A0ABD0JXD5_9CAEN